MASMPIRKDPAGFKTVELANARILANLVIDMEELILRQVARTSVRQLASVVPSALWKVALVTPLPSDFLLFIDTIDQIEMFVDEDPANRAAERIVWTAQAHGIQWASKNLIRAGMEKPDPVAWGSQTTAAFGITDARPIQTSAKPYYLEPDKKMIAMYKERVKSEIKNLTGAQSTGIKRAITTSFEQGETVSQMTKRIQAVTEMSKKKAITIARTETLAAGNAAAKERYKSAGVEKVEWIAAYDDRVCEDCEELHGNIYDMDNIPPIPVHPNCRCTVVPYREREET